ncbi:DNRLRE domain-containing protein [Moorella naiadis]|uniref:DNRLRE domain-containing protein n=1 Tax=Moorella naiadis (nom. illeg.) TaxID=3093670 RepID=UPI003D9CA8D5
MIKLKKLMANVNKRGFFILILGLIFFGFSGRAWASPLTINLSDNADTYVDNYYPNSNYGSATCLQASNENGRINNIYINFNWNQLPYGAVIVDGNLGFADSGYGNPAIGYITNVIDPWNEATLIWGNQPGTAGPTFSFYFSGNWVNKYLPNLGSLARYWNYTKNGIQISAGYNSWGYIVSREGTSTSGFYNPGILVYYYNMPGPLSFSSATQTSVTISWGTNGNPPNEPTYQLYRNGILIYTGTGNSFNDTGLQPGTSYTYTVYTVYNADSTTYKSAGQTAVFTTVPPAPVAPTGTISGLSWSNTTGRSRVVLNWSPVQGATGYKVYVWDGNAYRGFDVGNVTSWDSHAALIYPDPTWLASQPNNSISSDPFNHAGGGFDLQDDPNILYVKTIGTAYDTAHNYWFRVSAYNSAGESPYSDAYMPTLPNRTDNTAPSGSASVLSPAGLKKTYDQNVNVTVNASDSQSGIYQIFLSNDNNVWTPVYTATKNADNSTSITSLNNTFSWTVTPGAGTKTVYVKVVDSVGNASVFSDSIALADDILPPSVSILINGGASNTTSTIVTLSVNAEDNASVASQMQMAFSNDGNLWSPWEPYSTTKTWDLSNAAYGGNSSQGIKTVYVRVCDAAQNIGLAKATIGYSTSVISGNVTPATGTAGSFNGLQAQFTNTPAVILNLNYPGATQMRFSLDGVTWSPWEPYAATKQITLPKGDGLTTVSVQTQDAYGSISISVQVNFVLDTTPPVITKFRGYNGATASTTNVINLELIAYDNLPGPLQYNISVNGGTWSGWSNLPGSQISYAGLASVVNNIEVKVRDLAGNEASSSVVIWKL